MRTYGRAWIGRDGDWRIDAEPHVHLRLKRILGKISRQAKGTLVLSHTPENCRDLEWCLERYPLALDVADRRTLHEASKAYRDTIARLEQLIDPNYEPPDCRLALPLRSYQAREVAIYLANGSLLNADDVGLGKTAMAIGSLSDPRTLPSLVVTMTHLPRQWAYEIQKFAPALRVHIIKKGTPYELPRYFTSGPLFGEKQAAGPDVLIINYHKLAGWSKALKAYCKSVIYDEVQELRHRDSQKYGAAEELSELPFRLGLSATPIYNYGGEAFNILDALKPGVLGTRREFDLEWCGGQDEGEKNRIKDPKAFGSYLRESFLMIRHTRADVKRELPEVIKITHRVDADTAALDRVENTAAELARIILAQNETVRGAKFQAAEQLSVMLRQATGIAKAPYVADFVRVLAESEQKVVLCGWHREVYDIWCAKLRDLKPVLYTGSETANQKQASVEAFTQGDARILILSLRSGAGLNGLQDVCSAIVFGELDWSPAVHEQAIGRLARDGQTNPVVSYFMLAEDGADPLIAETLGIKREQAEGIRNPHADVLERLQTDGARAKRLAEFYLKRLGIEVPGVSGEAEEAIA